LENPFKNFAEGANFSADLMALAVRSLDEARNQAQKQDIRLADE
jgi:hypothetical protein